MAGLHALKIAAQVQRAYDGKLSAQQRFESRFGFFKASDGGQVARPVVVAEGAEEPQVAVMQRSISK